MSALPKLDIEYFSFRKGNSTPATQQKSCSELKINNLCFVHIQTQVKSILLPVFEISKYLFCIIWGKNRGVEICLKLSSWVTWQTSLKILSQTLAFLVKKEQPKHLCILSLTCSKDLKDWGDSYGRRSFDPMPIFTNLWSMLKSYYFTCVKVFWNRLLYHFWIICQ